MLRVGLTGGLASGKSFVGSVLASKGCHLIRADDLGHEVIAPDGEAYEAVVKAFGSGILREDGTIDRRALGSLVFSDPERLAVLNSLVHPAVFRKQEEALERIAAADPGGIAVVEAAIMIETGSHRRYQRLVLAVCPREVQIARAMERDHLTREAVLDRLSRQMPLEEKIPYADYVIDTSGDKTDTIRQTARVYESLRDLKGAA